MRAILLAASISLTLSLIGTPVVIRFFRRRGYGQLIRDDGPQSHQTKRGTPTMGGTAIILSALAGYFFATLLLGPRLSPGGILAMGVFLGMGLVGFLDDYIKIRRNRSLGLSKTAKFVGQALVGIGFAIGAEYVADTATVLSFIGTVSVGGVALDFGVFFPLFCFLILSGTSNAVNLTDGLDGLAAGTSALVFGAFTIIAFWIFRHPESYSVEAQLHADALAVAAASATGAVLGFLWWNAPPAKIFMGDTGSLGIGGMLAALAVLTETELLLTILGGLFVVITLSVIIQVASFRLFGRRVFKMAPLQHHFELLGWHETTIIVRFWIIGGLGTALALGLFYADYLTFRGGGA